MMPAQATRPKAKRLAARLLEAMDEISADARGIPSGVARFSLPPNPKPGDALAAMEAAIAEAEGKQHAYQANRAREQVQAALTAVGAESCDVAEFLGVSVATVKAWEAGTKTPTGANLRLLTDMVARPRYWKKQLRAALAQEGVS